MMMMMINHINDLAGTDVYRRKSEFIGNICMKPYELIFIIIIIIIKLLHDEK